MTDERWIDPDDRDIPRCLHPKTARVVYVVDGVRAMVCERKYRDGTVCGHIFDEAKTKLGKSSKRLGSDQERRAEKVYGWEKVGEFGTITDLRGTLMKVQQKATRAPVPIKWAGIFRALDAVNDNRTAAILLSFVAQGKSTEDFILIRGRDWLALHGRDES